MADEKYSTIQQHQPLRVPASFDKQGKALIVQLDEIFDDIYRRFGRLRLADMSEAFRKQISDDEGNIAQLVIDLGQVTIEVGNKYDKVSGIAIDTDGVDISGSKRVRISANSTNKWTFDSTGLTYDDTTTDTKMKISSVANDSTDACGVFYGTAGDTSWRRGLTILKANSYNSASQQYNPAYLEFAAYNNEQGVFEAHLQRSALNPNNLPIWIGGTSYDVITHPNSITGVCAMNINARYLYGELKNITQSAIPAGVRSSLSDMDVTGWYLLKGSNITGGKPSGCPSGYFWMYVNAEYPNETSIQNTLIKQIIFTTDSMFVRTKENYSQWTKWFKFTGTEVPYA